MNCPKCKKQINDKINFCPYCQAKINKLTNFNPLKQRSTTKTNPKKLVITALLIALSYVGAQIKIPGTTIAFDSLPAFLAALLLAPGYGAAIGFLGHIFTAMTSGFMYGLPLHIAIAISMAITMFGFGCTYMTLKSKVPEVVNLVITGIAGLILNGPFSLAISMGTLAVIANKEAAWGLLALLLPLSLASAANIVVGILLYKALEKIV